MKIIFHREARLEAAEAARQYEAQRTGRGASFTYAVGDKLEDVAERPGVARPEPDAPPGIDARRVRVQRFPYALVLVIQSPERAVLIAVAHDKREPGYWHHRVDK